MRPADWETKVLVRRLVGPTRQQRKVFGDDFPNIPTWYESKDDYGTTLANTEQYLAENPDDSMQTEVIQVVVANYALIGRPLPAPRPKVEVFES